MIVLFTDFGVRDPYVGQVKARLAEHAPAQQVVDLLHEVPDFNPHAGAHLLAAFAPGFPPGSVFLAVVDPGVGTPRDAVVVLAGGNWFVGPDNGLLSVVAARHSDTRLWRITWQPDALSATFHGRDLFALIAADIARGEFPDDKLEAVDALKVEFDKYVSESQRLEFLAALLREAEVIGVHDVVTESRDPRDDKFRELALSGRGNHIVTGDLDLLALHPFRGIAIVDPQSFLAIANAQGPRAEPSDEPDRNMPGERGDTT